MAQRIKNIPKYKGLRLFVVPVVLYYMLILPVLGTLYITNSPKMIELGAMNFNRTPSADSVDKMIHNIDQKFDSIQNIDTLIKNVEQATDSIQNAEGGASFNINDEEGDRKYLLTEKMFFQFLIVSFILGFIFSLPYKIFFRRKRRGLKIPVRLNLFCRKTVLKSPLILASIIALPFIVQNLNMIDKLFISETFTEAFQREMNLQYWAIFILAGILTVAFVFFWQKHNVQIHYLQHIFTPEELKKRIFTKKSGRIKNRLVLTSFLTTLLPLCIVVAYLLMSLTSLSDLGLHDPTYGELKVIFGDYFTLVKDKDMNSLLKDVNFQYINIFDTILLFIGIGAGIFVTIIYLFYFVHWTNSGIVKPINELLQNMQKTTGGQLENYSLVRTNDELGNLSENYNIMTGKLHEYISHIDQMNAELEQKVKERTAEIQSQKEEIEAQRDEVESQRDEIERQRDYVIEQRDLITLQKKAITDSIEYAANIQSAILPPIEQLNRIMSDYFIYFNPRDIVSGDFYWAHKIKKKGENQVIVVAADSTGHGVPGAFMSMLGITLLNEIIIKKGIHTPSEILDNLKENLVNSLHQTNEIGKSKDGIDISVCLIDFERLKLQFSGAYNSIYIVRELQKTSKTKNQILESSSLDLRIDRFGNRLLFEIKADKNPIGVSHKTAKPYSLHQFDLERNDVIYMFSDGYADQFGGDRRLKYLYSRFKELLAGISNQPMERQHDELNNEFIRWKGKEKQIDDILVMGIGIK